MNVTTALAKSELAMMRRTWPMLNPVNPQSTPSVTNQGSSEIALTISGVTITRPSRTSSAGAHQPGRRVRAIPADVPRSVATTAVPAAVINETVIELVIDGLLSAATYGWMSNPSNVCSVRPELNENTTMTMIGKKRNSRPSTPQTFKNASAGRRLRRRRGPATPVAPVMTAPSPEGRVTSPRWRCDRPP
jgi:hypothetical protein